MDDNDHIASVSSYHTLHSPAVEVHDWLHKSLEKIRTEALCSLDSENSRIKIIMSTYFAPFDH